VEFLDDKNHALARYSAPLAEAAMWYHRLNFGKTVEADAQHMLAMFGSEALAHAQATARHARGKDKKRAAHFARVALKIAGLTGQEVTSRASRRGAALRRDASPSEGAHDLPVAPRD